MDNQIKLSHSLEIIGMVEEEGTRTLAMCSRAPTYAGRWKMRKIPYYKDSDGIALDEMLRQYREDERSRWPVTGRLRNLHLHS